MKFLFSFFLFSIRDSTSAFVINSSPTYYNTQRGQRLSSPIISLPGSNINSQNVILVAAATPVPDVDGKSKNNDDNDDVIAQADALFDNIDSNDDNGISNDELELYLEKEGYSTNSIRYLFTALDKDADGKVSREEMRYAFSNYEVEALYNAFGLTEKTAMPKTAISVAVDQMKYNEAVTEIRSDAKIDDKTNPQMFTKLADRVFDMIDKNDDGEINKEELREFFQNANTKTDRCNIVEIGAVESIFTALDLDSDGTISRQEMRNGFQQYDHRALSKAFGFSVARRSEV